MERGTRAGPARVTAVQAGLTRAGSVGEVYASARRCTWRTSSWRTWSAGPFTVVAASLMSEVQAAVNGVLPDRVTTIAHRQAAKPRS